MGRKKSPQLKTQDAYDKDHRTQMENPHAFRKNWPKKKARENRRERVALRSTLSHGEEEDISSKAIGTLRKKGVVVKTGVLTLRASIEVKTKKRMRRVQRATVTAPVAV